jgi:EAL domain-containing protein (putative c-di-GMP-specific phosphodiesterase class I)/CheY-like chemotaxis protein
LTKKPLLLLVDDLKSNRLVVKRALTDSYDYIEAKDGNEALMLLKLYEPTLILIDAMMPNMDGFETTKKIRSIEKFQRTPILMVSSLKDVKSKVKALKCGINDFLTKPFDTYELRARCRSYIDISELNKQYVLATQNPITGFKNETALMKELVPNNAIFLFSIVDFYKIESIYGYKNSKYIEQKFSLFLREMVGEYINSYEVYHVNDGKYIVKLCNHNNFSDEEIENFCKELYENCKKYTIAINDLKYHPASTIIFVKDRVNLYEDALSALSYARSNNIKYISFPDDINGIRDIINSNIEILKQVKDALEDDKIINYYQPIYDNKKDKITQYETLVRLKDSDEIMNPLLFLDIAKSAELYEDITKKVFQNAFNTFKFNNYGFSINISYVDIENQSIRELIYSIMKENPHVSNRMVFEISEKGVVGDIGLLKEFVSEVRNNSAQIAIDNFGSECSNFQQIIDIAPDILKIDGSIVKNIVHSRDSYTLLESINHFAQNFNIQTVAGFISSKEIFDEVCNIGVDFSQGYYIGEPQEEVKYEEIIC